MTTDGKRGTQQVVAFAALPGNVEAARRALQPIDDFRAAGRRAGNGAREVAPDDADVFDAARDLDPSPAEPAVAAAG